MSAVKTYVKTFTKSGVNIPLFLCVRLRVIEVHTDRQSENALSPICLPTMPITAIYTAKIINNSKSVIRIVTK